jgi:hypothetical protein
MFEDTKGVIWSHKSKNDRQYSVEKKKSTKGHSTIYKILHRKLKIEQHEPLSGWTQVLRKGMQFLLH